ncbi:hypothetical protein SO802_023052 [Lithocarpus litseifolius]|uniref:Uncharacterized protein n=1 Tax=Lithocarpus litseifolius TaxID=425828 RepID=A0AAW2C931_9ROSI
MYPTMKVRVNEQDDQFPPRNHDNGSMLFLSLMDSLSIQAKENRIDSPSSIAGVTKARVPNFSAQLISMSKGTVKKNNKQVDKSGEQNRANSAPRPRAILSSPDNDGMIGSWNKLMEEKYSDYSIKKKMQAQTKVVHNQVKAARPLNTKKVSHGVSDDKSGPKQRKLHEPVIQKQKPRFREGKSSLNAK